MRSVEEGEWVMLSLSDWFSFWIRLSFLALRSAVKSSSRSKGLVR